MDSYTKKQIAEISELRPRQIQFYTEQGVIVPEEDKGIGRGKVRRYSKKNLLEFLIVKKMADRGITVSKIKRVVNWVHGRKPFEIEAARFCPSYLRIFTDIEGKMSFGINFLNPVQGKAILNLDEMKGLADCYIIDFRALLEKADRA